MVAPEPRSKGASDRDHRLQASPIGQKGKALSSEPELADVSAPLAGYLPPNGQVLSYRTLLELSSWEEVTTAYSSALGSRPVNDDELLEWVKRDWAIFRSIIAKEAISSPLPVEFPRVTVAIGSKPIDVFGICHSMAAHPEVTLLLRRSLVKCLLRVSRVYPEG